MVFIRQCLGRSEDWLQTIASIFSGAHSLLDRPLPVVCLLPSGVHLGGLPHGTGVGIAPHPKAIGTIFFHVQRFAGGAPEPGLYPKLQCLGVSNVPEITLSRWLSGGEKR